MKNPRFSIPGIKRYMRHFILTFLLFAFGQINLFSANELSLINLDPHNLAYSKTKFINNDKSYVETVKNLCADADISLQRGPYSVVYKKTVAPSGDIHDYMSLGPYWWPDSSKSDGLPYIRRDGIANPERDLFDIIPLRNLDIDVTTLSLAYFFSGEEKYARHATLLIRTWFLNDESFMNPHLKFGQAIRGKVDGRGTGIIDTRPFIRVAEAIGLIAGSDSWSAHDQEEMKKWFNEYINWLLNSDYGTDERKHQNNHGTWYDVLASSLAMFTGQKELAGKILNEVPQTRIAVQFDGDGKQPFEITRTRAFHYSVMNLQGLFQLALIGEKVGIDLWSYESENGRSIRLGLDYLIPYAIKTKVWPYQMIKGWEEDLQTLSVLLRVAAKKYHNPAYEEMINRIPDIDLNNFQLRLIFPDTTT